MRILVVEDESTVASFLRRALEEEGYAVDAVLDGEEGLQSALAADYDLLILDWMLPNRTGLEICRAVRRTRRTVSILMLTARESVDDRIQGLDTGADDYLTKPFSLGELLARTRALLRRGSRGSGAVLTAGDLSVDPATRRVVRGGQEVHLSAREYALLEYLLRHAGRTVTRTMIAEHVWDLDFDAQTNVVEVYINYLRNKIDRGRGPALIHTVRGVGYRLEAPHAMDIPGSAAHPSRV